jgi:acetyl esterase/lipase
MTTPLDGPPRPPVHRVAGMQLRGRAAPLATRVYWPAPCPADGHRLTPPRLPALPALLVLLPGVGAAGDRDRLDALARGLCTAGGLVVLALLPATDAGAGDEATALRDARTTLDWAADHAAELGADGDRLVVAGWASGAVRAAVVAQHACDDGWPPIARQVLICPEALPPAVGAGAAPATVVTVGSGDDVVDMATSGCGARLRRAGLRVDELRYEGLAGGEPGWAPWSGAADLVVADLARSLQHRLGLPPTEATRLVADTDDTDEVGVA